MHLTSHTRRWPRSRAASTGGRWLAWLVTAVLLVPGAAFAQTANLTIGDTCTLESQSPAKATPTFYHPAALQALRPLFKPK